MKWAAQESRVRNAAPERWGRSVLRPYEGCCATARVEKRAKENKKQIHRASVER
jgi:hypothetical protein